MIRNLENKILHMIKGSFSKDTKTELKKSLERINFHSQDYVRIVMYQETKKMISDLDYKNFDVLEISGGLEFDEIDFKSLQKTEYPGFDICQDVMDQRFDLIIADQVWEHLLWPYKACKNVLKMLRAGGYFLNITPFMIRVHHVPVDCTRWTETGMKYFLAECGFPLESIVTDSWGNRRAVVANFDYWVRGGFRSLKNESLFPVMVWALARAPLDSAK